MMRQGQALLKEKTGWRLLLVLVLLPLMLRLAFVFYVEVFMLQGKDFKYGDEKVYHNRSWGISVGHYPKINAEKIGYYGVVTPFYYLFGPGKMPVILFQCLLGAASCALVYLFARDAFSKGAGIAAWLLCSLYPPLIWWCGFLLKESVMVFLTVSMLYAAFRAGRAETVRGFLWRAVLALACGLYLGIMRLTFFAFLPIILVWMVAASKKWRDALFRILGFSALLALLLIALKLPGLPLEKLALERITPHRMVDRWAESFYSPSEQFAVDNLGWMELYKQWRTRPWTFIKRLGLVWRAFSERPPKDPVMIVTGGIYLVLLPFFFYGMVCALIRNPRDALVMICLLLVFTMIHLFTLPRLRFRIQMMPIVLIFAAVGLTDTIDYLKSLKESRGRGRRRRET
jgi:4-amino-4-deoxy-L-arabinose transferase-like glycosyltransferase